MNKDIIKLEATHGYVIDVMGEISTDYDFSTTSANRDGDSVPTIASAKTFVPFRLSFLGPPNIRGQRPDTGKDGRYHITVGTQQV